VLPGQVVFVDNLVDSLNSAAGDALYELRTDDPGRIDAARAAADGAVVIGATGKTPGPLVLGRIA